MTEIDDYESLPEDTPFRVTAMAGAFAGIAEHVALYPVDSVKVWNVRTEIINPSSKLVNLNPQMLT